MVLKAALELFTYDRSVRLILEHRDLNGPAPPEAADSNEAENVERPKLVGMGQGR